jgi:hypothetical protein
VTGAVVALAACSPRDDEPGKTSLPTRATTIDPVVKKLDAASQEIERRRETIDAAK